MNWQTWSALLASASLLAACGGGGGSSDTSSSATDTDASVTLSGTAAKGLMANADVKVHPIKDGNVDTATVLASTTTDAAGKYTLPLFKIPKSQPYVVRVSAKADGSTTHLDEVTKKAQALPASFAMRSVMLAPSTTTPATTTTSITPFTEMAVAAAAKASGGVTAANAAQAVSTVSQLLGFDPTKVAPAASVAAATSDDEKKLAVMLTAVSQLANSADLGCTGDNGAKTQCVVTKLAEAATTTSIKLSTTSGSTTTDISAKLGTAVSTVLADTTLVGSVGSSTLATVVANLGCTTNCAAATTGTTPTVDAVATAIASAKLLFAQIKSDWTAMFSNGGASSLATGAVNQQAWAFQQAMTDIRVPVDVMAKDVGAIAMGIDLYNDYKARRTTDTGRSRGDASQVNTDGAWLSEQNAYPAGCSLYQDDAATVLATGPANANFIGCGARHYVTVANTANGTVRTEWRHGFTITPPADGTGVGAYTYTSRARKRVQTCTSGGCVVNSNESLQADAFAGTATATLSATNGDVTRLVIAGDLPAAFVNGGTAIDTRAYKHTLAFDGTQTVNTTDGTVSSAASGTLVAKTSAGATVSTVTLKPSSLMQLPVSFDANGNEVAGNATSGAHTAGAASLNLVFANASGEFEGVLSLTDATWDKSQTVLIPTKATLSGALRTISGSTTTEFLKGVLSATMTGFASYDATAAASTSNSYRADVSFVGTVTAPNRPTLELSIGSGMRYTSSGDPATTGMTMQYRTLVNGTPRTVVSLTGTANTAGTGIASFKLTEATSNLALTWAPGASSVDLWLGDTSKIGTLAVSSGVLTFTDSSFISLDIGL